MIDYVLIAKLLNQSGAIDAIINLWEDDKSDDEIKDEIKKVNTLHVKKTRPDAIIPSFGTNHSAGLDLTALPDYEIKPNNIVLYNTGLKVAIPAGNFGAIYPRSGLSLKGEWTVANNVGVIDSSYRGEVKVMMRYLGNEHITNVADRLVNTRIAQMVIQPYNNVPIVETYNLPESGDGRDEGGFGSTGS